MSAQEKEAIHRLVEELPEAELTTARRVLEALRIVGRLPGVLANAPLDDEPETEAERRGAEEARAELAAGKGIRNEEVRREFGW